MTVTAPTTSPDISADPPTYRGRAWLITGMMLIFMLINFGDKAILGLAAKPIMAELGLSASQYGVLSSAFFALFSIAAIVVGFVTNRVQTRWVLAVIATIWALTQLPMLMNVGFLAILVSRVVLGAAEGPANPLAMHAVQQWFPDNKRGLPCAIVNLGAALGVVVLAPAISAIIIAFGWRWAFATMFVVGIVWVAVWLAVGREGPYGATAEAGPGSVAPRVRIPYRRIFLCGTTLSVIFTSFTAYWALSLLISWVPLFLEGPVGFDARATGLLIVVPWAVSGVLILAQGFVTDALMSRGVSSRVARVFLGAGCGIAAAGALLVLPIASTQLGTMICVALGFAAGGVQFAVGSTLIAEITPVGQRAAVLATATGLYTTAGLIAPYVTGRLVEAAGGTAEATGFTTAFALAGALVLAGAVVLACFARPERDAAMLRRFAEPAPGTV